MVFNRRAKAANFKFLLKQLAGVGQPTGGIVAGRANTRIATTHSRIDASDGDTGMLIVLLGRIVVARTSRRRHLAVQAYEHAMVDRVGAKLRTVIRSAIVISVGVARCRRAGPARALF